MKHKKPSIHRQPWTAWVECEVPSADIYQKTGGGAPDHLFRNSRYQVSMWFGESESMGRYVHLSIKDHDKSVRHDWRDMQRIKNELVGPEYEGIELYPAESRLVDTANQYHLFVFSTWKPDVGFKSRLVADGEAKFAPGSRQRPFEARPADCLDGEAFDKLAEQAMEKQKVGGFKL